MAYVLYKFIRRGKRGRDSCWMVTGVCEHDRACFYASMFVSNAKKYIGPRAFSTKEEALAWAAEAADTPITPRKFLNLARKNGFNEDVWEEWHQLVRCSSVVREICHAELQRCDRNRRRRERRQERKQQKQQKDGAQGQLSFF